MTAPPRPPTILALRHAQSEWNADGRIQGQADPPLSAAGEAAARAAAARHAADPGPVPVLLVTSDLRRAAVTGDLLGAALGARPERDPDLREVAAGDWEGLTHHEVGARWPEEYRRWRAGEDVRWGGAERAREAGARVAAALRRWEADARRQGRRLVAVGHGASLRAGVAEWVGWQGAYLALAPLDNLAALELESPGNQGDGAPPSRLSRWNVPLGGTNRPPDGGVSLVT